MPATATDTLVNPVSIEKRDKTGTRSESIRGVRGSTAGKLLASDSFPQSSYVRWTVSLFDNAGRLAARRAYHTIPAAGDGDFGTHHDETIFDYDSIGRQNLVESPGGTITRTVFNVFDQPACVYVGTDDSDATDEDPSDGREPCLSAPPPRSSSGSSGSSAGSNNMVLVTEYEYAVGNSGEIPDTMKEPRSPRKVRLGAAFEPQVYSFQETSECSTLVSTNTSGS